MTKLQYKKVEIKIEKISKYLQILVTGLVFLFSSFYSFQFELIFPENLFYSLVKFSNNRI